MPTLNSYGKNVHFIDIGDIVTLERREYDKNGSHFVFYSVPIEKWYKGKNHLFHKSVKFPRDKADLKNGTRIKILSMFEDVSLWKNVAVWEYMITEYQIVSEPDLENQMAVLNYQQQLQENRDAFSKIIE